MLHTMFQGHMHFVTGEEDVEGLLLYICMAAILVSVPEIPNKHLLHVFIEALFGHSVLEKF